MVNMPHRIHLAKSNFGNLKMMISIHMTKSMVNPQKIQDAELEELLDKDPTIQATVDQFERSNEDETSRIWQKHEKVVFSNKMCSPKCSHCPFLT